MCEAAVQQLGRSGFAVSQVGSEGDNSGLHIALEAGRPVVASGQGQRQRRTPDRRRSEASTRLCRPRDPKALTLRLGVAATSVFIVAALVACGSGAQTQQGKNGETGKPGSLVVQDAKTALLAALAVHIRGKATTDSSDGPTDLTIDIRVQTGGAILQGRSTKASVDAIVIDRRSYVKFGGDAVGGLIGKEFGGKWLSSNGGNDADNDPVTLEGLADELVSGRHFGPAADKVTATSLDGRPAALVSFSRGAKLWVAGTGAPYPLKLDVPKGGGSTTSPATSSSGASFQLQDGPITLTFVDYGVRVPITAPSPVVDPNSLLRSPSLSPSPR